MDLMFNAHSEDIWIGKEKYNVFVDFRKETYLITHRSIEGERLEWFGNLQEYNDFSGNMRAFVIHKKNDGGN